MSKKRILKLHKLLAGVMATLMLITSVLNFIPGDIRKVQAAGFDNGDGSAANPYQISTLEQLQSLANSAAGLYYVITCDIDARKASSTAASKSPVINGNFNGILDGNGNKLTLDTSLCQELSVGAVIKNIQFTTTISDTDPANGVAYCTNLGLTDWPSYGFGAIANICLGVIDNCQGAVDIDLAQNEVRNRFVVCGIANTGKGNQIGTNAVIRNCGITGRIHVKVSDNQGAGYTSGICSLPTGGKIEGCYARLNSSVTGYYGREGSLVGEPHSTTVTLINCYGYNESTTRNTNSGSNYGFIGRGLSTLVSATNCFYGAALANEPAIGGVSGAVTGITATTTPAAVISTEDSVYRKWSSATSFASYDTNPSYGRSTITLDPNEGQISSPSLAKVIGENMVLPTPTRVGYNFIGWAQSSTATTALYEPDSIYYGNNSTTLYAIWARPSDYYTNYGTDSLSNKANDLSASSHKMSPADNSSRDNLATIKVHLTDINDEILIYKVADVTYDQELKSFSRPAWTSKVSQWISDNNISYTTPASLANAFAYEQKNFYSMMFLGDDGNLVTNSPYELLPFISADYPDMDAETAATFVYQGDPYAIEPCIDITGFEAGEYVVIATNGNRHFTPFVVNIIPERYGANGSYYLLDYYDVYLKAAGANVTKYIVEGKPDSIATDDETDPADVHMSSVAVNAVKKMRLSVEMPNYSDRVTLSSAAAVNTYTMTLTDIMDQSMMLCDANGDIVSSEYANSVVEVYYKDSVSGHYLPLDSASITYIEFADASYTGPEQKNPVTSAQSSTLSDCYYVVTTGPLYTMTGIPVRPSGTGDETESGFTINFNMAALKYWAKSNGFTSIPLVEVRYNCVVTDGIRVASEQNINTATIAYEVSADGSQLNTQSDVVNLYTYGLAIHKLDGDTNQALAGAGFYLYKRIGEFRLDEETQLKEFVLTDSSFKNIVPAAYLIEDDFNSDKNFYVLEQTENDTPLTTVFIKLDFFGNMGSIITTIDANGNNDSGDQIQGLTVGQYILEEHLSPTGYNRLAEDMLFEISGFTPEEATDGGFTLASLKSETGAPINNGIYDITVLNYKGIVLPATGGAGTLLFGIIGAGLMTSVIVIIGIRRRQNRYADEYGF